MYSKKKDVEKNRRISLATYIGIVTVLSLYAGLHLGAVYHSMETPSLFGAMAELSTHMLEHPFSLFPSDGLMVGIFFFAGVLIDLYLYNEYLRVSESVNDAHGDAAFETNRRQYDLEFVLNPQMAAEEMGRQVTDQFAPYNEEHKQVLRRYPSKKIVHVCTENARILADGLYMSMDGKWTQRNNNEVCFGASGAGKSRFLLTPNLLQLCGSYVVVDASGDIEQNTAGFFEKNHYRIKRFSTDDMEKSCRFNPLYYIRKTSDILLIVNTLMENTQDLKKKGGGDGDFWTKSTQALLCAIIGYEYEVLPMEQRNFSNLLEILRMNNLDEHAEEALETDFDKLFLALGDANPASYAYHQYLTFKKAPAKTALNILISTAVLISQYVDIPEFSNLTYKDELELDRLSEEKMVLFLNIPLADRTYSWITAMLFSLLFSNLYHKGKERMETEGLSNPELKIPVRFLIDECRNIGKIGNLGEYLATCRKYQIAISVIFQNYSQIVEVYGKEEANSIIGNCDTMIFLGGSDSDTLKIICDRLGKETVKTLSFGNSKGRMGAVSTNKQDVGKELMSRIQVEQMSNTECLVFIRALRPFKVRKYRLEKHPNYRYLSEADKNYLRQNSFQLTFDEEEMEAVRIKPVGEEGYIAPSIVDSPRRRAQEREKRKREEQEKEILREQNQQMAESGLKVSKLSKSKEEYEKEQKEIDSLDSKDVTEELVKLKLSQLWMEESFDPGYEFE